MGIDFEQFESEIQEMEKALEVAPEEKKQEEPAPLNGEAEDAEAATTADDEEEAQDEEEAAKEEEASEPKAPNPAQERINKRKALEQRNRELELELARIKGQQEGAEKAAKPKEEVKQEEQDIEPDPLLETDQWKAWNKRQMEKQYAPVLEKVEGLERKAQEAELHNQWLRADKKMQESNPVYADSKQFLRTQMAATLKAQHPNATPDDIQTAIEQVEKQYALNLKQQGLDVDTFFIGEAIKMGHNPFKVKAADTSKPKTDTKEVALHKRNAGSVLEATSGGGKTKMTASDVASMSTMESLFSLGNLSDKDWQRMAEEAI